MPNGEKGIVLLVASIMFFLMKTTLVVFIQSFISMKVVRKYK